MIPKYLLLVKMNLRNSFRINEVLHSPDKKQRNRTIGLGILYVIIALFSIGYSVSISFTFVLFGIETSLPSVMLLVFSLLSMMLTFMKSNGSLFYMKDHDMVMSMPVSTATVLLSRLTTIYIFNLLMALIILGPATIIFSIVTNAKFSVWFMGLFGLFFAPLIPMTVSFFVSVFILALSSRFKYKNLCILILNIAVILGVMSFGFHVQEIDMGQIANLGTTLDQTVVKSYPLAKLFSNALTEKDWISYGKFVFLSVAVAILFIAVLSRYYTSINAKLLAHSSKSKYIVGEMQVNSPLKALYKKELRRLFSCPTYALNSVMGAVLLLMGAVSLLFVDPNTILAEAGIPEQFYDGFIACVPFILCVFIGMNATTSSALSIEGKSRWLMCSAPVKAEVIFNAKIAVNLTIMLPTSVVAVVILSFALPINVLEVISFIVILFFFALYISVFDLFINAKFPTYDWTNEQQAVKQGTSVLLSLIVGFLSSLVLLGLGIILIHFALLAYVISIILLMVVTYFLYERLRKIKLYV